MNKAIFLACCSQLTRIAGPCVVHRWVGRLTAAPPASSAIQRVTPGGSTAVRGDEMGWKVKVSREGDQKVFVVEVQPNWAKSLGDHHLA